MDKQTNTSSSIVDHRSVATHSATGLFALLMGMLFGRHVPPDPTTDRDYDLVQIVSTAIDRGQDFWAARQEKWRAAHVVLVDHDEDTACGVAGPDSGPFYCPRSERIFVDLSFLRAIHGDLARAYVIAHELGHHVQKVRREFHDDRGSIATELQADCYAGMWMHEESIRGHLAGDDFAGAVAEAASVGDDRICPTCSIEQWTHGSAAQRVAALQEGFKGGPCH